MFGCWIVLAARASLKKRVTISWFVASSGCSTLTATRRPMRVLGEVDRAHPALAEQAGDAVVANALPDHRRRYLRRFLPVMSRRRWSYSAQMSSTRNVTVPGVSPASTGCDEDA